MDSLERFVRENREKLDIYEPSPAVWEKIAGRKTFPAGRFLVRLSAAVLLAAVIGTAFLIYNSENRKNKLSELTSEVKEMELFYNSLASTLYTQAKPLLTSQPEIEKELENDLARIDEICAEIKKDLKDNVSNQEVIEALIRNYTIKIRILEDMLRILNENENNTEKRRSNEL
jgi:CHASE3 domain sensor protein